MDINTLLNYSEKSTRALEKILQSSIVNAVPSVVSTQEKSKSEADALVALKKDPAVMEARVCAGNNVDRNPASGHTNAKVSSKKEKEPENGLDFENMLRLERFSLMSLSPNQLNLLMKYADTLRMQRLSLQKQLECAFCKKNGQPKLWYTMHALKDGYGRIRCPILRTFICRRCGATGNNAHTIKYCPKK